MSPRRKRSHTNNRGSKAGTPPRKGTDVSFERAGGENDGKNGSSSSWRSSSILRTASPLIPLLVATSICGAAYQSFVAVVPPTDDRLHLPQRDAATAAGAGTAVDERREMLGRGGNDNGDSDISWEALMKSLEVDNDDDVVHTSFVSGRGVQVHRVSNFLPLEMATRWRDIMAREWDENDFPASQLVREGREEGGDDTMGGEKVELSSSSSSSSSPSWTYTTNNDGSQRVYRVNNQKVRSISDISARNATAQQLYTRGAFSYGKWELDPDHPLVREIENVFESEAMKSRVMRVLKEDDSLKRPDGTYAPLSMSKRLSDLFVTHFTTGDFLSSHNDGNSGSWAFVLSLMDGPTEEGGAGTPSGKWDDEYGGHLRFECPFPATGWCEHVLPGFNTATFFRTRPVGPMHEVLKVNWEAERDGYRRFGFTGWYMNEADEKDEAFRAERDKMRARPNIGTSK